MNPKEEMDCFNARNNRTNGNLKRLCRMARAWKSNKTVLISGYLKDKDFSHEQQQHLKVADAL